MAEERRDSAFDIGRLLRKVTVLEETVSTKVTQLERKVSSLEVDQQRQNETLQKIMATQTLQGERLSDVDTTLDTIAESAREWALLKPLKKRVGWIVWAALIAIPGYAFAFGVQYAHFDSIADDVAKLKRDADSDEPNSPAAKEKKWQSDMVQAVHELTNEVRAGSRGSTERIDNINSRTRDIEKALSKRRILRAPP